MTLISLLVHRQHLHMFPSVQCEIAVRHGCEDGVEYVVWSPFEYLLYTPTSQGLAYGDLPSSLDLAYPSPLVACNDQLHGNDRRRVIEKRLDGIQEDGMWPVFDGELRHVES